MFESNDNKKPSLNFVVTSAGAKFGAPKLRGRRKLVLNFFFTWYPLRTSLSLVLIYIYTYISFLIS